VTNPFQDQREFMLAFDQSVTGTNTEQYILYHNLVIEEIKEFLESMEEVKEAGLELQTYDDEIPTAAVKELIKATGHAAKEAMDVIVVATGYLLSMGVDPELAWKAVHDSNMGKLDPETGKPILRKDGKVQKPTTWRAPDMETVVLASWVKDDE